MQPALTDIIIEILTIAEYAGDKETFVKEFEAFNILEAIFAIYNTLPQETQKLIEKHQDDPQAILPYIPQEEYIDILQQVTQRELDNLIKSLVPTFTMTQKAQMNTLITSTL